MKNWNRLRKAAWCWRGVLIAAPGVSTLVILVRLSGLLQPFEWAALDQFFRSRPAEAQDSRIVIVGMREADIKKYGFPLPDRTLATLLNKIKQQKPSAIGMDLYRDLQVGSGYAELVKVYESTPNLIGIQKVVNNNSGVIAPPLALEKLGQVAANDLIVDGDGKLRRGLLTIRDREGQDHLGLAFALALVHLNSTKGLQPETTPQERIKLGNTVFEPFQSNDGSYVRADDASYQLLLNYRSEPGKFATVSVEDVLQGKVSRNQFAGKIVLIGSVAESLNDFFETPYNVPWAKFRNPLPGVEAHAQITSQILSSVLDSRPSLRTWAEASEWAWIAGWSLLGALLVWQQRSAQDKNSRIQSLKIFLSLLLAAAGLITISFLAFLQSWWLPLIPPLLGLSGSAIAVTAYLAHSASDLRKTLGRYLTDEVVARLLETPEGFSLVGEKRKVTILMTDIRGFTSISEKLAPEEVVQLLNLYLKTMTKVIKRYGGIINDITGDGIVIFFGAPVQQEDDTHRAVACAIAMQLAMDSVNQEAQEFGLPSLEIGIGINTGDVIVGNIGSEELAKYTAIGKDVNLASRIESFTVGGQILISPSTFADVRSHVRIEGQTQAHMKGVDHPVSLYEVSGIDAPYSVFLPSDQDVFVVLKNPILVEFETLEGKHLSGKLACGKLFKLSSKGAAIQGAVIDAISLPQPLTNLKLKLVCMDGQDEEYTDIYAKVTSQVTEEGTSFCIRFTDIPAAAADFLQAIRSDRRARQSD